MNQAGFLNWVNKHITAILLFLRLHHPFRKRVEMRQVAARRGNPQLAVLAERHAVSIVRLGVEGFQLEEVLGADGPAVDGRRVDDGFATVGMAGVGER